MIPDHRVSTHPGEVLLQEYLKPLGISQSRLAQHLGIPLQRINTIINGKRGITPATAWLFAQAFGTTPEFWTNLQNAYDLTMTRPAQKVGRLKKGA